ncbi:class I SAM-dependent methyltransferase [Sphingomonas limnosediminicola]|jgi:SAM-dependent methyltransferase|uniref:Class I SAM-dependent methyltransferase n=1 Tax=Sphingomonas limnosediminicola TaxID=940133 RepID=A0ABP7LSE7_9SPHN
MTATDIVFAGSIPGLYDRYLGPLLFEPYAAEVARRAAAQKPKRILEVAAGTGIVTQALHQALPHAEIVATDLNPAMLEVAAQRVSSDKVSFSAADALHLPFDSDSFDLVVSQFGIMFYPDRVKGNAEARRVLRDGGHYFALIWDRLDQNPASRIAHETVAGLYPDDPPTFLTRTPFGYTDIPTIERDMRLAGFETLTCETVRLESRAVSANDAATGLVAGSPLRSEVEARDGEGLDSAIVAVAEALRSLERDGRLDSHLSAHLVTATK